MSASAERDSTASRQTLETAFHALEDIQCLSWLLPDASSLVALSRLPAVQAWSSLQRDPSAVLLVLRHAPSPRPASSPPVRCPFPALLEGPAVVHAALQALEASPGSSFIAWDRPGLRPIYLACRWYAALASLAARRTGKVDPEQARVCGLLAPLGWIAVCGMAPQAAETCLASPGLEHSAAAIQKQLWGADQHALTRRLLRRWTLPPWLAAVLAHLGLSCQAATPAGGDAALIQHVQVAIHLGRQMGIELGLVERQLARGAALALGLGREELRLLLTEAEPLALGDDGPWVDPRTTPLLPDLLTLARENRSLRGGWVYRQVEEENDRLHEALAVQTRSEADRARQDRLSALAELAAGAGHEINNPLAVISGQAQYLLGHEGDWFAGAEAGKVRDALQAIIAQTRRIHSLLRELMLFARPGSPRKQLADLPTLLGEVAGACREHAEQHRIRLEVRCEPDRLPCVMDVEQIRLALGCLVRNAIEAAAPEGWVRVALAHPSAGSAIQIAVEDSGAGPASPQEPFLFDPFYSGRSAGRGRGMGLPIAWRLARVHDGDVRLDPPLPGGPTRFVLSLPWNGEDGPHEPSVEGDILSLPPAQGPATTSNGHPAPRSVAL